MDDQRAQAPLQGRAALERGLLGCASAVAYYALARAGQSFADGPGTAALFWPAAGFALAATVLWGPSAALGVLAGAFLAHEVPAFPGRDPAPPAVLAASGAAALGAAVQALAGAAMLRLGGAAPEAPRRAWDAALFLLLTPVIAAIGPLFELLALAAGGAPAGTDWGGAAAARWIADASGLLVAAPMLLAWARPRGCAGDRGTLLESVRDYAIFRVDRGGRVSSWSRGAELLFGYGAEEATGSPYARLFPSEDEARRQLEQTAREGRFKAETWSLRKDGTRFWADIVMTALFDEGGAPHGVVAVVHDATQRRAAAQGLEKKTADLSRSNQELSQFAYVASHDLSAPLHKVKAFADRLRDKVEGTLDEEGRDYFRRMTRAVDGMQALINALLELARVTTRVAPCEVVELGALAKEVAESLEPAAARARGRVEIGPLPRIDADPLQMRQLLQNLISNGLKFHKPGEAARVRVRGKTTGDGRCELVVSDDGIGFDMKHAERIFQPFQRLQAPFEYEGTGMGLAICQRIVARHGGAITASSAPGRGAEFRVVLPVSQEGRMGCRAPEKAFK